MTDRRSALLIVRAWVERGATLPLRAYIRLTQDVSNGFDRTTTVTSPEAGAAVVKGWLEDVLVEDQRLEDELPPPPPPAPDPAG